MFPPIGLYSSTLRWVALAFLATLAACTSAPPPKPAGHMMREQSRWVPVTWNELPGWHADSVQAAWPALVSSCQRPAQAWTRVCSTRQHDPPRNNAQARSWLMKNLQPYRVESLDGATQGLITGYYEPLVEARRKPAGTFRVALYEPPADLVTRRPYWTRQQIDTTDPLANRPLRRLVLAQDTGSAIVGAVRADYFWGWDGNAAEQAGRMRQPLRMWVLWPRQM